MILFFKTVYFLIILLGNVSCQFNEEDDEEVSKPKATPNSEEDELFFVRIPILEIGDERIRIYGKKLNITDSLGNSREIGKFSGIPFAQQPIKNLRFQRPTMNILRKDFRAIVDPPPCPQTSQNDEFVGDESCLHLNIYIPQVPVPKSEKFPVLVWFHGESFDRNAEGKFGLFTSGSAREIDPQVFILNKIIVVTPQYRLGTLGFVNTVNEDLNGNMGLFDQLQALEWVQVTLMGQGSSAISSGLLSLSDLTRGLFSRLILMSGSPLSPVALDSTPKLTFAEIALQNSCPSFPTLQFVRCMQDRKLQNILSSDQRLSKGKHLGRMRSPLPIIQKDADGRFLPPIVFKQPALSLSEGSFEAVPLIIGVSSSEMSGFLPSLSGKTSLEEIEKTIFSSDSVLKHFLRSVLGKNYPDAELISDMVAFEYFSGLNVTERKEQAKDLLEELLSDFLFYIPALSLANMWSRVSPVYFYLFDYVPIPSQNGNENSGESSTQTVAPLQANHGSDIRFLMNGHNGSALDREISSNMVDFWINFIHKGSPLNSGTDWPQFREETKEFLKIGEEIEAASGFRTRQFQFWSELVPRVNKRVCGSSFPSTGRGTSSLTFGESGRKVQKVLPLIFKDVAEADFSKKFFTSASFLNDEGDDSQNKMKQ